MDFNIRQAFVVLNFSWWKKWAEQSEGWGGQSSFLRCGSLLSICSSLWPSALARTRGSSTGTPTPKLVQHSPRYTSYIWVTIAYVHEKGKICVYYFSLCMSCTLHIILSIAAGICWHHLCHWCDGFHGRGPNLSQAPKGLSIQKPSLLRTAPLWYIWIARPHLHPSLELKTKNPRLHICGLGGGLLENYQQDPLDAHDCPQHEAVPAGDRGHLLCSSYVHR